MLIVEACTEEVWLVSLGMSHLFVPSFLIDIANVAEHDLLSSVRRDSISSSRLFFFPIDRDSYAHMKKDVFHEGRQGKVLSLGELLLSAGLGGIPAA